MAVPAHDQRDFEFAKKYGLDIVVVVKPDKDDLRSETMPEAYLEGGIMVNSGQFNGMNNKVAMDAIASYLEEKGIGKKTVSFRLKDWGISRQRYWGAPIPMIHCDSFRCSLSFRPPMISALPENRQRGSAERSLRPEAHRAPRGIRLCNYFRRALDLRPTSARSFNPRPQARFPSFPSPAVTGCTTNQ